MNSREEQLKPSVERRDECAAREKYWSELREHERTERLRRIVKAQGELIDTLQTLVHRLLNHEHGLNGRIVQDFDPYPPPRFADAPIVIGQAHPGGAPERPARNPDDVYF